MCDDLDGYLMEPDKHTCANFRAVSEVLTAIREGTSTEYAMGAAIALGCA